MKTQVETLLKIKKSKQQYLTEKEEGLNKRSWTAEYEMDEFGQYYTTPVTDDEIIQVRGDLMEIELEISLLEDYINGQEIT